MPSVANQVGQQMRRSVGDGPRPNVVSVFVLILCVTVGVAVGYYEGLVWPVVVGVVAGVVLMQSPKVAKQWDRAVVLRLGRYVGLRGPGLFWVVPFFESVSSWVDQRVITTSFAAEE